MKLSGPFDRDESADEASPTPRVPEEPSIRPSPPPSMSLSAADA